MPMQQASLQFSLNTIDDHSKRVEKKHPNTHTYIYIYIQICRVVRTDCFFINMVE